MMALPIRKDSSEEVVFDPFAELNRLRHQLQAFFDRTAPFSSFFSEDDQLPLADLEETDDAFLLEVEVPGVRKEDIHVEVAGRRLIVSGERKERERKGVVRRRTRAVGTLRYEVVLPGEINEEGVTATLEDGVLTIRAPKAEQERSRTIPVT
jgi:heat shock protein Hsp20